jgi:hypothetical protein
MRYYFHVHDDGYVADLEGLELSDDNQARQEAMLAASEFVKDIGPKVWSGQAWQMRVEDETGRHVFSLVFKGEFVEGTLQ